MSSKSKVKKPQKVEIKNSGLKDTLSIVIPIALVFVFLVGGFLLFIFLEDGRWVPDEGYIHAERLIKENALVGLTFQECVDLIGDSFAITPKNDYDEWQFLLVGYLDHTNGVGNKSFSIYIQHENGRAVKAVMEETRRE
jgi:hypothetical protein